MFILTYVIRLINILSLRTQRLIFRMTDMASLNPSGFFLRVYTLYLPLPLLLYLYIAVSAYDSCIKIIT